MLAKLRNKRGFTLVELMIVVAIIGVLAALAIYGVKKYLTSSKTAEVRSAIGRMSKDAANAFNAERMTGQVLAIDTAAAPSSRLCGSSTKIPSDIANIAGQKYQSSPELWDAGTTDVGWKCLRFSMDAPQYFQYQYVQSGSTTGPATGGFGALGKGDLDGDGVLSTFAIVGAFEAVTGQGTTVKLAPGIDETNPDE